MQALGFRAVRPRKALLRMLQKVLYGCIASAKMPSCAARWLPEQMRRMASSSGQVRIHETFQQSAHFAMLLYPYRRIAISSSPCPSSRRPRKTTSSSRSFCPTKALHSHQVMVELNGKRSSSLEPIQTIRN